jgi:outer membrane lipoprotein
MKAKEFGMPIVLIALALSLFGCATAISKNLRGLADPDLTYEMVKQNPDQYKKQVVIWGGEIVKTTNVEEGTRIEILQKPLDFELNPKYGDNSDGRFIALYDGYLDSAIYEKGREITVGGEIAGTITSPLDQIQYTYPVVAAEEIHLWSERRGDPYLYPYPSPVYHRWWYGPYWYY